MPQDRLGFFQNRSLQEIILAGDIATLNKGLAARTDCNTLRDIEIDGTVFKRVSPLHLAVRRLELDMVEQLLKHHANVHACDGNGNPPISYLEEDAFFCEELIGTAVGILMLLVKHGETYNNFVKIFGWDVYENYLDYLDEISVDADYSPRPTR